MVECSHEDYTESYDSNNCSKCDLRSCLVLERADKERSDSSGKTPCCSQYSHHHSLHQQTHLTHIHTHAHCGTEYLFVGAQYLGVDGVADEGGHDMG